MPSPLIVSASRTIAVPVDDAFERTLTTPLPQIFSHRYGVLPAVKETTGFTPPWGSAVGQTRTVRTTDGGSMRETLLLIDRSRSFAYQLNGIKGPMVVLAASVEGQWAFAPADTGTQVTWSWTVRAANALGSLALPAFGRMWQGYAARALQDLEQVLLH